MKTNHICSFSLLVRAAQSVGELERLAGVCDVDALRRSAARAFKNPATQWEKLVACLRRRIAQRYDRGELLAAERRALAVWCGEATGLWGKGEVAA